MDVNVVLGSSSMSLGCSNSEKTRRAWLLKTHLPGSIPGHAAETPIRLIRRQKRIPICTSEPL
ncbi:hypothetical protein D3C83_317300 [compost metagenome]